MKLLQSFEHFLAGNIRHDYVYAARIFLVGKMSLTTLKSRFFPPYRNPTLSPTFGIGTNSPSLNSIGSSWGSSCGRDDLGDLYWNSILHFTLTSNSHDPGVYSFSPLSSLAASGFRAIATTFLNRIRAIGKI